MVMVLTPVVVLMRLLELDKVLVVQEMVMDLGRVLDKV